MISARFVRRFCGVDSAVSLHQDDPNTAMSNFLAYASTPEADQLAALDNWTDPAVLSGSTLTQLEFDGYAGNCLDQRPDGISPLSGDWEPVLAQARVGHDFHDGGWIDEDADIPSAGFTAYAVPLRKRPTAADPDPDTYHTAMVGNLLVRVDYWLALSIDG